MGFQNRWTVENAGHIMNIRSQPFRQFYDFVPGFFLFSHFFAKRLFWVSQKLKLGARRSEKPLFFIDFFLYFHFSFSLGALWSPFSPHEAKNPLFPLSILYLPEYRFSSFFLINRGITEWEWGERSFFFVFNFFTRMNNYLESSLSYYVKQNSNQPMKTNPTLNQ